MLIAPQRIDVATVQVILANGSLSVECGTETTLSSTSSSRSLRDPRLEPSNVWTGQDAALVPVHTPPCIHQPQSPIPTADVSTILERHSKYLGLLP